MRSMDSILGTEGTLTEVPDTTEAPEKVESEKLETKTEPEQKPDKTEEQHPDDDESVPDDLSGLKRALAAARGDKRKARKQWRDADRELAELRGRLSAMEQRSAPQPQQAQKQQIDLTDEEFFGKGPEAIKAYIKSQFDSLREESVSQRLMHSEAAARERHQDFNDALEVFKEAAKAQPYLWQQMTASHDPGEFVYRTGKTYQELQGVTNLDELRQKIEAEVRAKLQSETAQQEKPLPPKSIAASRGTGTTAKQTWAGPRSFEEILR